MCVVGLSKFNDFYASTITKYFIPLPKEISLDNENKSSDIIVAKFKPLMNKLLLKTFVGKIKLWKLLYSVSEVNFVVDSSLKKIDEYYLEISDTKISIKAKSKAALFYAMQTLLQIIAYSEDNDGKLPEIIIHDYADFERRGFMLDISRDKVPTMETLFSIIDKLAFLKINEFQLYTEHTFAYKNHKVVWQDYSPMTADEIKQLDDYCKSKYIDLVPNQNSFGHMERWLEHEEYLELAECPTDCNTIWGIMKRTSLDPTNPKSFELIKELYSELLPNFSSKFFNIGCDETVELGLGKSAEQCKKIGKGRVYLDFLIKLNAEVNNHGKRAQFWGDIIVNHPELVAELPKNMIALVWGYDSKFSAGKNLNLFKNADIEYYVCPGTSTWNSIIGRNHDAFLNLENAALKGKEYNAKGFLNTCWGDYGHWQPLSVSYPTILLGAAYAWNQNKESLQNLEFQLNYYIFKDKTGNTAKAILKLGNAYLKTNIPEGNANAFHLMLQRYKWTMDGFYQTKALTIKGLMDANKEIIEAINILDDAKPQSNDADIVIKEIRQAANIAMHGIKLGIARLNSAGKETANIPDSIKNELYLDLENLIEQHKSLWIVRNREGGLKQSSAKLEKLLNYYKN